MSNDNDLYNRDSPATGWFVGIVVALALLAIGYLIFEELHQDPQVTKLEVVGQ